MYSFECYLNAANSIKSIITQCRGCIYLDDLHFLAGLDVFREEKLSVISTRNSANFMKYVDDYTEFLLGNIDNFESHIYISTVLSGVKTIVVFIPESCTEAFEFEELDKSTYHINHMSQDAIRNFMQFQYSKDFAKTIKSFREFTNPKLFKNACTVTDDYTVDLFDVQVGGIISRPSYTHIIDGDVPVIEFDISQSVLFVKYLKDPKDGKLDCSVNYYMPNPFTYGIESKVLWVMSNIVLNRRW